ncbi:Phosphoglycerate mutase [Fasciola gigantica]|uniref:Fructose-2,6-bisphosphatase TIGAR n=1 Tax=Fasciola gigantica TaxID=46835 RepID=A0A504YQB7_FASGI|nr:Phosphoglycerate mutase [Fasciola gigantica]
MTEPTTVYAYLTLIRHGETMENVRNIIQGHLDTDLSPTGVRQASELRNHLGHLKPDLFISSDLKRASSTACALGLSTPLELDARLRERNFGTFSGSARRDLQQFAQSNASSGNGCDGWRSVGAECSHEVAARTSAFLMELCSRLAKHPTDLKSVPTSAATLFNSDHSKVPPMPRSVRGEFGTTETFVYGGHVVMVSHGGWIRQLLRLLAFQSKKSAYFPKDSANSVMRNCAVCHIGLAFDPVDFEAYAALERISNSLSERNAHPLPAFGSLYDSGSSASCEFLPLASPQLPLVTVCYHFNVTVADLQNDTNSTRPDRESNPAVTLCSKMDVIFSDDGDEYAGQPNGPSTVNANEKNDQKSI